MCLGPQKRWGNVFPKPITGGHNCGIKGPGAQSPIPSLPLHASGWRPPPLGLSCPYPKMGEYGR